MLAALPTSPIQLPIIGQPPERSDAAANRRRILAGAQAVLAEHGAAGLSMNAVAAYAGVGKGTIFRRFGDRLGLLHALLDEHTAALQDGFLSGPTPLGPGAPAAERLEAFVRALLALYDRHLELMLAADVRADRGAPPVYGTFVLHVATLVRELDPTVDAPLVAELVLSAIDPRTVHRLRHRDGTDLAEIEQGAVALLRGLTGRC
jgi:AcrR family transcriptional regulator